MSPTIAEMISTHIFTANADISVREAAGLLTEKRIGALPVVDKDTLVGIFTERDLLTRVVDKGLDPTVVPLREVMTSTLITIRQEESPFTALHMMLYEHIRHLPVVDNDGKIIGMVGIRDLLKNMLERAMII